LSYIEVYHYGIPLIYKTSWLGGSFMKLDYWKNFITTGKIDDYLNYIACTREEITDDLNMVVDRDKEGGFHAGINYRDGDGSIGHAGW
jgi:hypothetical protein